MIVMPIPCISGVKVSPGSVVQGLDVMQLTSGPEYEVGIFATDWFQRCRWSARRERRQQGAS